MERLKAFFRVWLDTQTYNNIIYLLLSFPLGLAYFLTLMVGLPLGLGLSVVLIGIPILILLATFVGGFVAFERGLTNNLLRDDIPTPPEPRSVWEYVKSYATWKQMGYLMLKLPLGIFAGMVSVFGIMLPLAMITAPFQYGMVRFGGIPVDNPVTAVLMILLGVFSGTLYLHAMNGIASAAREMARHMLGAAPEDTTVKAKRTLSAVPEMDVLDDREDEAEALGALLNRRP